MIKLGCFSSRSVAASWGSAFLNSFNVYNNYPRNHHYYDNCCNFHHHVKEKQGLLDVIDMTPFIDRSLLSNQNHSFNSPFHTAAINVMDGSTSQNQINNVTSNYTRIHYYFPIYYNDVYQVPLPPNHRFPMNKYKLVRERIQRQVSLLQQRQQRKQQQEVDDDKYDLPKIYHQHPVDISFRISPLVSLRDLSLTHCQEYIARYIQGNQTLEEIRNVGFPWSMEGVSRSLSSTGGTVAAAKAVCEAKRFLLRQDDTNMTTQNQHHHHHHQQQQQQLPSETSFPHVLWAAHVAGGTHHAFYDRGEGFCVFSDIAVAANVILRDYPDIVRRILILDLDVHQGNGNAVLFQGRKDVVTFSMHCSSNYFSKKEESDLDIELPPGCEDETYLSTLHHWLNYIYRDSTEKGQKFDFIFYQAGVDILHSDRLGKMNISPEGVSRRNKMVYDWVRYKIKSPMVITMGGGYPKDDNWEPILEAHSKVYIEAFI